MKGGEGRTDTKGELLEKTQRGKERPFCWDRGGPDGPGMKSNARRGDSLKKGT